MSASVTSGTKTITDTDASRSAVDPEDSDRWSHHINYRQLVASSCIGIMQLWWHPYVHDLKRLLPFLFLYNLFSILLGYPLFYLELALGAVTKKGLLSCWDLAPIARGVSIAMLVGCVYTVLALSVVSAYCLALFVHSCHSFLPWLHCVANTSPPCSARHRPMSEASDTPSQSFFFNYVLKLRREGLDGGLGSIVWELSSYYVISWVLIYFISVKRIYSFSKLVLFKDVLTYFTLTCSAVGVLFLEGASAMFSECEWGVLFEGTKMWREAIEFAILEMTVSQGTLIMLGSYCPQEQNKLSNTALLAFIVSKSTTMGTALILGAVHGALRHDYAGVTNIWGGASAPIVLWADYVTRIPGSQFWSALVFFTLFVLSITSVALLVLTMMSAANGHAVRKISWALLIFLCFLFSVIGILTMCSQGGLFILNHLMSWPVMRLRVPIATVVAGTIVFIYGEKTFCEDVYFAVREYPCLFYRVCWAVCPTFLLLVFVAGMGLEPPAEGPVGWILVLTALLPIGMVFMFYVIFKCRVRNIVKEK